MDRLSQILPQVGLDVWSTVVGLWPFLLLAVVTASAIQVYVGTERIASWLRRRTGVAVLGSVALASLTPFCSCGTTAVVLGALASSVPWAPVVAFMVASPLTSPSEFVLSAGLFGTPFAVTFVVAAAVIGLAAGGATALIERTGVLAGQARMRTPAAPAAERRLELVAVGGPGSAGTGLPDAVATVGAVEAPASGGCGESCSGTTARPGSALVRRLRLDQLRTALWSNGRRLVLFFLAFTALGYLVIRLIPTDVLTSALGGDSFWSVPLAALLGIPMYVNTEGSLPLVAGLMEGGMGVGPALAFLVTGAGTSIGAISGMLVIARWRVVALVVASLVVGAMVLGWLAPLWL